MARTQQQLEITTEEEKQLQHIVKKGTDWRQRERAQTILDLAGGKKVNDIAAALGIHQETVRVRRRRWKKEKFFSLQEKERTGAPRKLNEPHKTYLASRVGEDTSSPTQLLTELDEKFGLKINPNTLANTLKEMGYIWKSSRYSLINKTSRLSSKRSKRSKAVC